MATVLITGGTGLIGKALSKMLIEKNHSVVILTRKIPAIQPVVNGISYALWNVEAGSIDSTAIASADYIIHLAGAGVADKRWTAKRKKEIVESRTKSGELIVKALTKIQNNVKAVISSSAIGWYGADNPHSLQNGFAETDNNDESFLGNTCRQWEQSLSPVETLGKRLVFIRTGIVLANEGGAYMEFKKPLRFSVAAILGSGEQVVSWIHIEDICRMYLFALEHNISGAYNGVAPMPVNNKELTLQLAKKLRNSFYIAVHVPVFILKILLGEMSVEILKSATVSAHKIRAAGFKFLYPSIDAALTDLVKKQKS
ncbi:MAG TPA: TIGR01777 family oxidoreductase [Panacibacter sp.]|nr:TIGR01777 family oxidoreductase [Panacibacter sp.]HNP42804.1 TIGR01777 family oxidoreductase [Panacibacter sp.]